MATWFVRPVTDVSLNGNGTSVNAASVAGQAGSWRGFSSIVWGNISPGDSLYICGLFREQFATGKDGTSALTNVYIRGDYQYYPGEIRVSNLVTSGWSIHQTGLGKTYVASHSLARATVTTVFCDYDIPLFLGGSANTLTPGTFYWDDANDLLYVRLFNDSDPSLHSIEICNNLFAARLGHAYNRFSGLHVSHGDWSTVGGIILDKYNAIVQGCSVVGCEIGPCGNSGLYINEPSVLIEDNYIHHCWNGKAYASGGLGYGIVSSGVAADANNDSSNAIIRHNLISLNNRGIVTQNAPGWKIYKNDIIENLVNGIDCRYGTSSGYVDVYNNLVIHRPTESSGHGLCAQINGHYTRFKNNIVYCDVLGSNVECLAISESHHIEEDSNCFFVSNGALVASLGYTGQQSVTLYNSLSGYKSAMDSQKGNSTLMWTSNGTLGNAAGENTISGDPLLTYDYHLQPTSPCVGTGTEIAGITTDIEGNQLYPPYNIGPYGAATGALTEKTADNVGPVKKSITATGQTGATFEPGATYKLSDDDQTRDATGFTYGTEN